MRWDGSGSCCRRKYTLVGLCGRCSIGSLLLSLELNPYYLKRKKYDPLSIVWFTILAIANSCSYTCPSLDFFGCASVSEIADETFSLVRRCGRARTDGTLLSEPSKLNGIPPSSGRNFEPFSSLKKRCYLYKPYDLLRCG